MTQALVFLRSSLSIILFLSSLFPFIIKSPVRDPYLEASRDMCVCPDPGLVSQCVRWGSGDWRLSARVRVSVSVISQHPTLAPSPTTNHTQRGVHRQEKPWRPWPIRWAINAHIEYLVLVQSEAQEWNEISASLVNSLFGTYAGIFRAMGGVSNRPSRTWQFLHAIQMYYCHTTDSRHSSASLVCTLIQNNITLKTVT